MVTASLDGWTEPRKDIGAGIIGYETEVYEDGPDHVCSNGSEVDHMETNLGVEDEQGNNDENSNEEGNNSVENMEVIEDQLE